MVLPVILIENFQFLWGQGFTSSRADNYFNEVNGHILDLSVTQIEEWAMPFK